MEVKNVLGGQLVACCRDPVTGFFRDGFCQTSDEDVGAHVVCAQMTAVFLQFSLMSGNDLTTPKPESGFPGLQVGDFWCLCVSRWLEAYENDVAPPVYLEATHERTLEYISLDVLQEYAIEKPKEGQEGHPSTEILH